MNYGSKQQDTRKRFQQHQKHSQNNISLTMRSDNPHLGHNYSPDRRQPSRKDISYFKNDSYEKQAASTHHQSKSNEKGRLSKMNNLLASMMEKHQQMKRKLQILRKEKENHQEQALNQFSFAPKINYNPRYQIASTLNERNRSWDEARAAHFTSKKQEIVEKVCKECTFSPTMLAKRQSDNILNERKMKEERERLNNFGEKRQLLEGRQVHEFRKEGRSQPALNKVNIKRIRDLIKGQVKRIDFDF